MQYRDLVERLWPLPEPLPAPADALIPVLIGPGPGPGPSRVPGSPGRAAAVLVLVHPDRHGTARVVLIERAGGGRHHRGEVGFPGGKAEPEDRDLETTALREAVEEVGLDAGASGLRVLGTLDPLWIPVSDFAVTPVLAAADRPPELRPSAAEVAAILTPPVAAFGPDARVVVVERTVRDWPLRYGTYQVDGRSVWGATARILSQLGALAAGPPAGD